MISSSRGKAKVYVLVDDNINLETDARVAAVCADSYIGRPGMLSLAFETIFGFANNVVLSRQKPAPDFSYEAASAFLFKNEIAWVISGKASAIMFVDGKPVLRSEEKAYPSVGSSPAYKAKADGPFKIQGGETALLLSCGGFWMQEEAERIGNMLKESESPKAWTENILKEFPERCTSIMAAYLPAPKRHLSKRT